MEPLEDDTRRAYESLFDWIEELRRQHPDKDDDQLAELAYWKPIRTEQNDRPNVV